MDDAAIRNSWFQLVSAVLRRHLRLLGIISVSVMFSTGLGFVVAGLTRDIVDDGLVDQTRRLEPMVGALIFLAVLLFFFGMVTAMLAAKLIYDIEYELRDDLYTKLMATDPRELDGVPVGQVVTRAMTDLRLMQLMIGLIPFLLIITPPVLAVGVFMWVSDIQLTIVAVSSIPANLALVYALRKRAWALSWMALHQRAVVTTAVDEPVRGIRVVKAFGREGFERGKLATVAQHAYRIAMTRVRLLARYNVILDAIPTLVSAALLLYGGVKTINGDITLGTFTVFLGYAAVFTGLARSFDEIVNAWFWAKAGSGRMADMMAMARREGPLALGSGTGTADAAAGLEVHNVDVTIADQALIRGLSLSVGPGELAILQGPPGSGKTLVGALITGGVQATAGTVQLGGRDIDDLTPHELSASVRLVSEEPFFFARSVRENLVLGAVRYGSDTFRSDVSDEVLHEVLAICGATDVIAELDDGLETVLGDRGMTLSGGQRQRLGLARALLSPTKLLVLDDALSAVNPSLEVEIIERIKARFPDTAIVCSSRRAGPATLADVRVELPSPTGVLHDPVEAAGDVAFARAMAADSPVQASLAGLVANQKISDEAISVTDEVADNDRNVGLWTMLGDFKARIVAATFILLVITLLGLAPARIFGWAVDAIRDDQRDTLFRWGYLTLAVTVALALVGWAFRIYSRKISEAILLTIRRRVFRRLTNLGVDFYDRETPGKVATRIANDIDVIEDFIQRSVYTIIVNAALLLGAIVAIGAIAPSALPVVIGFVVAVGIMTAIEVPMIGRVLARARDRLGDVIGRLEEDLTGRYLIRDFGAGGRTHAQFRDDLEALRATRRTAAWIQNTYSQLVNLVVAVAIGVIYLVAGDDVLAGGLTVGAVFTLRFYMDSAVAAPIPALGQLIQSYIEAGVSFDKLQELYDAAPGVDTAAQPVTAERLSGAIELDDVTFTYPGTNRQVLHGLSLEIAPREVVAVVGVTGSGKSTLSKLLIRTYDPDAGAVRVDGVDARQYDPGWYRRRFGVVPQDAFVFRGTVASNIKYGNPDATIDEVEEAAAAVGALDALLSIENGLYAHVDEEGRNLTTAQRQLIALARAWLARPDVLLLDEATSSLDVERERDVLDAVRTLDVTAVLVTHRLHVAERADRIYVVDQGRVVEQGSPDELRTAGGYYSRLWHAGDDLDAVTKSKATTSSRKRRAAGTNGTNGRSGGRRRAPLRADR